MSRRFYTLDVFTESPLAGNPLAVVLDADDLSEERMQAIAREFNLAETVFVCQPRDPVNTARIRIFTVATELPFAGHPTVGSAVLLASLHAPEMMRSSGGVRIALEEKAGLVPCDVVQLKSGARRGRSSPPRSFRSGGPSRAMPRSSPAPSVLMQQRWDLTGMRCRSGIPASAM